MAYSAYSGESAGYTSNVYTRDTSGNTPTARATGYVKNSQNQYVKLNGRDPEQVSGGNNTIYQMEKAAPPPSAPAPRPVSSGYSAPAPRPQIPVAAPAYTPVAAPVTQGERDFVTPPAQGLESTIKTMIPQGTKAAKPVGYIASNQSTTSRFLKKKKEDGAKSLFG